MTRLAVFCDPCERPTWEAAAALLRRCVGAAVPIELTFAERPEALEGDVTVASLLPALWETEEAWPQTAARWRAICARMGNGALTTVFRAVPAEQRARVRRLNLLAAELSQATGVSVIDLDRVLADRGARPLGADARLQSEAAQTLAAFAIARTCIDHMLDDALPDAAREAAAAVLDRHRPSAAAAGFGEPTGMARTKARAQVFHGQRSLLDDRGALALLRDLRHRRITLAQAAPQLADKILQRLRR